VIDAKIPLVDKLQTVMEPPQYRAATSPKYHGDTDPHKFLMCYETTIASSSRDDATITKLLIISLEGVTANWYIA
jgi:hypothetical protein